MNNLRKVNDFFGKCITVFNDEVLTSDEEIDEIANGVLNNTVNEMIDYYLQRSLELMDLVKKNPSVGFMKFMDLVDQYIAEKKGS